jgi:hypothetical protein
MTTESCVWHSKQFTGCLCSRNLTGNTQTPLARFAMGFELTSSPQQAHGESYEPTANPRLYGKPTTSRHVYRVLEYCPVSSTAHDVPPCRTAWWLPWYYCLISTGLFYYWTRFSIIMDIDVVSPSCWALACWLCEFHYFEFGKDSALGSTVKFHAEGAMLEISLVTSSNIQLRSCNDLNCILWKAPFCLDYSNKKNSRIRALCRI